MTQAVAIATGTRVGRYIVVERLGQGSSATVYLAHDPDGNAVALKVRQRGRGAEDRRFLREFEAMRALRLPGVVRVHEAGLDDDLLWFSMDLVWGRPFLEVAHEEKATAARVRAALDLGENLLSTLAGLHQAGFVHRDVKPSNVLVDKSGAVHVLDFGISQFFEATQRGSGPALGTLPYMAPEQLAGLPHDGAVDLFAAGLMLWEAMAGRRVSPKNALGWIAKTCLERQPALATLRRDVPRALSDLVERMTEVDPHDRPTAAEATERLRAIAEGMRAAHWPEPVFDDTSDWWSPLEGALGGTEHPPVWIVDGPCGSGRRRAAEQVHRLGLMQNVWPLHARCRVQHLGGPIETFLEAVLQRGEDEAWCRKVVGSDGAILRRVWPHLPLPGAHTDSASPTLKEVADAAARTLTRAARERRLLLVVHDLENLDVLTARSLHRLARDARSVLGLILIHDGRWRTPLSRQFIEALRTRHGASVLTSPTGEPADLQRIAASLCPRGELGEVRGSLPQHAVETGLSALAAWRGEDWTDPDASLWPLAVLVDRPIPRRVVERLVGPVNEEGPWVRATPDGLVLSGQFVRRAVRARLGSLASAARALADAWVEELGAEARSHDLAVLRLVAGDAAGAWEPAARAILDLERSGRYAEARRALFLLDTLPLPPSGAERLSFRLALAQARVALGTEAGAPRFTLVDAAEQVAATPAEQQRAKLLRAEYQVREGQVRGALVNVLRIASPAMQPTPEIAVRALILATGCRNQLGQLDEAARQVARARKLLDATPDPTLVTDLADARAENLFLRHELERCVALCERALARSQRIDEVRGVALFSNRLGRILRLQGRRRKAEQHLRVARVAFATTGDLVLDAETRLALATTLVERGDSARARNLIDDTIRRLRGLQLYHLMPTAMRVVLQCATTLGDARDADVALQAMRAGSPDPEAAAAQVRWWRIRGDIDRALAVEPPPDRTFGHALWRAERARAALVAGRWELATDEADHGLLESRIAGFSELVLYARLLRGAAADPGDTTWDELQRSASASLYTEVYLGAVELDARRLHRQGRSDAARARWRTLRLRSEELGYQPGVEEATGWLATERG